MDYTALYTDFLKKHVKLSRPLSIVCDSSNGATGPILERLLPELGLEEYTLINATPDGDFPAHGPNPLLPGVLDELSKIVVEKKADFGVAFDADGDRAFFVDEKGTILPSFIISALLFRNAKPPFVADELVYQTLRTMKLFTDDLHPSRVGVFFIKEALKKLKATTGAEFSGHFYYRDFFGSDSGLFTMIKVLSILSSNPQSLSEFAHGLPKHMVTNDDLKIEGMNWQNIEKKLTASYSKPGITLEKREGVTVQLPNAWVNVRPSNTEPILRFYAGAETEAEAKQLLEDVKKLVV